MLVPSVPVLFSPGSSGILPDLPNRMAGELIGTQLILLSSWVSRCPQWLFCPVCGLGGVLWAACISYLEMAWPCFRTLGDWLYCDFPIVCFYKIYMVSLLTSKHKRSARSTPCHTLDLNFRASYCLVLTHSWYICIISNLCNWVPLLTLDPRGAS